jgi:hypothetical protein
MGRPLSVALAATTSMRANASGAFARVETHLLMTAQEAKRAMQMVKDSNDAAQRAPHPAARQGMIRRGHSRGGLP